MSRIAESAFGDTPYPESPGFKKPGTSSDAAAAVGPHSKKLRADVLDEFVKASPAGLTADEVAGRLGKSVLSIRPRVSELGALERIVRTGQRRANESGLKADEWRLRAATVECPRCHQRVSETRCTDDNFKNCHCWITR